MFMKKGIFLAIVLLLLWPHVVRAADPLNANVRFDVNGGNSLKEQFECKVVPPGQTYGELPVPTRSKHLFQGWNTKADGTGDYVIAESTCLNGEEHILYAIWLNKKGKIASPKPSLVLRNGHIEERTDGRLKIRFQKVSRAKGYQVRFGQNKKFKKKSYETLTLAKNDNIIYVYGVPPYKTYYVKVRAFIKRGNKRVYGKWSKVKKFESTLR